MSLYPGNSHRKFFADLVRSCGFKKGAEIGVFKGTLSRLLFNLDLEYLILVDPFDSKLPHSTMHPMDQAGMDEL